MNGQILGDGTRTSYTITYGADVIASGEFLSGTSSVLAATTINNVLNSLTTHTSTLATNVVTATSVINSGVDLIVAITQGTNDSGSTSTNDLSVVRTVTQSGADVDTYDNGMDGTIQVFVGTTELLSMNVAGMTTNEIATIIFDEFFDDTTYGAAIVGNSINLIGTTTGMLPAPSVQVMPGLDANGDPATLNVARTTVNDGSPLVNVTGTPTSYTSRSLSTRELTS